jgi:alpha 1,6-mannosyltransferase
VWTDQVNAYLRSIGVDWKKELLGMKEAKKAGDTLLLTITAFSPGVGHMGSLPASSKLALVSHKFLGSWKDKDKKKKKK